MFAAIRSTISFIYSVPQSDSIHLIVEKRGKISCRKIRATLLADLSGVAKASGHPENMSSMTMTYLSPLGPSGRGPTVSTLQNSKFPFGKSLNCKGALGRVNFVRAQTWQRLTWSTQSRYIVGQ